MSDITIVPYTPECERFVIDSFVKSYQAAACRVPTQDATLGQLYCRNGTAPLYTYAQHMLARSRTLVATAGVSANVLIAWMSVNADNQVEYVYVKHAARRMGIAKELLEAAGPLTGQVLHTWPWTRSLVGTGSAVCGTESPT